MEGCKKSDRDQDTETLSSRDNAIAMHIMDDVFRQLHRYAMNDTLLNDTGITLQKLDACIDRRTTGLSDTVAVFPLYLDLNYGDKGTPCDDTENRYGLIEASFSGKYLNKGTVINIDFKGFRKALLTVETGEITIINKGLNGSGRRYYEFIYEDILIKGNNININLSGEFTYEWVQGSSTDTDVSDDIFEITKGFGEGRNSRGNNFTCEIYLPWVSDFSCAHFTSGTAYLEVNNLTPRTINYGERTVCDNVFKWRRDNTYIDVEIPIMENASAAKQPEAS